MKIKILPPIQVHRLLKIKKPCIGLPGGSVVKNPPANAGHTGSIPGPGKIPHATEQLSPRVTTTEPVHQALQQEKPPQGEARAPQQRVVPTHRN